MISRILSPSFLFLLLQINISAQNFWQPVAPIPPRLHEYSTCVVGSKVYFWCESAQLYSTSDAGKSFTFYPYYAPYGNSVFTEYTDHGIAFADSLTGYITDAARGDFRTTDGGKHWTNVAQVSGYSYVAFGSSKVGWKLGGLVSKTTDAGKTWTYLQTPLLNEGFFTNLFAMDENNLWALKGANTVNGSQGAIWYSSNGGTDWSRQNVGIIMDSLNYVSFVDLKMTPSGAGYAIGRILKPRTADVSGVLLRSTDFGKSWRKEEFEEELFTKLEVINDSTCIAFGNSSLDYGNNIGCRRTSNWGITWQPVNSFRTNGYNTYYTSAYVSSLKSILVSTSEGLYLSSDLGLTFSRISSQRDILAVNIAFDNHTASSGRQLAAAISYNKDLILSSDGGSTWVLKNFPDNFEVENSKIRISGNVIYLIEGNYRLHKSTDMGYSWNKINLPSFWQFSTFDVPGPDSIILCPPGNNLVVTTDGGTTWSFPPFTEWVRLNDIKAFGTSRIFAAGAYYTNSSVSGVIYSSANAGKSWHVQEMAPEEMKQIEVIDGKTIFAMGKNTIYATWNGGGKWDKLRTNAVAFAFYDELRGVILTRDSSFMTADAGRHWTKAPFDLNRVAAKIWFNSRGDLFALSDYRLYVFPGAAGMIPRVVENKMPSQNDFRIYPNHPNPFNPSTTIRYELPSELHVELKIYDILGREVAALVSEVQKAGQYNVRFDGSSLPSGVYIYTIKAGKFVESNKLLLLK